MTEEETVLDAKALAEAALKEFKVQCARVTALGYTIEVQQNDTLYIYKREVTQTFGEKYNAPNSKG